MLRATLLSCAFALVAAFAPAPARRPPVVGHRAAPPRALARSMTTARTALRARDDDIPEQPEYDVEPILGNGNWQSPTTLTLVGFALIAFNFFVLAGWNGL